MAALLIAIANAWLVATLSRVHRTRSATLALWLVLGGAGIAVALGTSEVWIPAVVHNDGSLIGMFAYAAQRLHPRACCLRSQGPRELKFDENLDPLDKAWWA